MLKIPLDVVVRAKKCIVWYFILLSSLQILYFLDILPNVEAIDYSKRENIRLIPTDFETLQNGNCKFIYFLSNLLSKLILFLIFSSSIIAMSNSKRSQNRLPMFFSFHFSRSFF